MAEAPWGPRDLSFHRVENPKPKKLSPAKIDFYNQNGYLKPFRIFDEVEAHANRAYFDGLLAAIQARGDGRDAYSINGYHLKCRSLYDLARHPAILDLVEDLTGPDFVCWGSHYFCKLPGDPKVVPWHQDASYWPFSPARTVTVWLAIDDADRQNACMEVLPGTHLLGPLIWKNTHQDAVLNQEIVEIEQFGEPILFELRAGEISLHADMLAHGSGPNHSSHRRCGLTLRYCPVSVRSVNDDPLRRSGWNHQAILARGADPSGHWSHHPRPETDDLSPMPWQANAG